MDEHTPPHEPHTPSQGPEPDPRDPGTPVSRLLALFAAVVAAAIVIGWQNIDEDTQAHLLGGSLPETPIAADAPAPGGFGPVDIQARLFVRAVTLYADNGMMAPTIEQNFAPETITIPEDRVRAIVLTNEYLGSDAALDRIGSARDAIQRELESFDPGGGPFEEPERVSLVLEELDILERIYTLGQDAVTDDTRARFDARYGVVGRAATTHGLSNSDPRREPTITGFLPIAVFLLCVGAGAVLACLAGVVLLIVWVVMTLSSRQRRHTRLCAFKAPAPGGSVFLETYAVFVLGFLVLAIGSTALAVHADPVYGVLSIPLQWLLLLTVFWALLRGMRFKDWRLAMGLHSGRGVLREVLIGIAAYIATVPLYIVAALITFLLLILSGLVSGSSAEGYEEPLTNPIMDIFASADILTILILYSLATLWAPITEELIFRGALHRHFRARMPWIGAAMLSALLFAFMHSYGPLMVTPLITLALAFSFVREWRGSIIAPMVMHFVHNFTLLSVMLVMILMIKDPF